MSINQTTKTLIWECCNYVANNASRDGVLKEDELIALAEACHPYPTYELTVVLKQLLHAEDPAHHVAKSDCAWVLFICYRITKAYLTIQSFKRTELNPNVSSNIEPLADSIVHNMTPFLIILERHLMAYGLFRADTEKQLKEAILFTCRSSLNPMLQLGDLPVRVVSGLHTWGGWTTLVDKVLVTLLRSTSEDKYSHGFINVIKWNQADIVNALNQQGLVYLAASNHMLNQI